MSNFDKNYKPADSRSSTWSKYKKHEENYTKTHYNPITTRK